MARPPTAATASRSRRLSPTSQSDSGLTLKRSATSSTMPGAGLRQLHPASGLCGQKNTASMRPPALLIR